MNWQSIFRVAIRIVFLFAFAAFLFASIRHVATFFHNFEGEKEDWVNPFMLAISIDATALMLTIGVMFFSRGMPWYAKTVTWLFIIGLTGFSWIVNWEYARTFQGTDLKTGNFLHMLNPVLASSFAFLNLAYSVVAEFFDTKGKTAAELQAEADRLEGLEAAQKRIDAYRDRNKKKSFIQSAKETLIEAKEAVIEVRNNSSETSPEAVEEEVTGNFLGGDLGDDLEAEEFPEQVAENPRTTIKIVSLTEAPRETDRNTDKLVVRNRKPVQSGNDSGNNSETMKRIRGILKRKPYITVSELATKANVSKGYASKVRSQFLKEHEQVG